MSARGQSCRRARARDGARSAAKKHRAAKLRAEIFVASDCAAELMDSSRGRLRCGCRRAKQCAVVAP
eukprot:4655778-Pyramimonas_sp.AAC.1